MAHREIRDEERCEKSLLLGVHVWAYSTEATGAGSEREIRVVGVQCHHCGLIPPTALRSALEHDYEVQLRRDRIAKELNKAQKEGTGTGLTRKA